MDSVVHLPGESQPSEREPVDVAVSRYLVALLVAAALSAAGPVRAQSDALTFSASGAERIDEIPPELQLPDALPGSSGNVSDAGTAGDVGDELVDWASPGTADWPARLESTGTWFRRGFWYVEQDVVVLNRDYSRNVYLTVDASNAKSNMFISPPRPVFPSDRELIVERAKPDAGVAARFTLGRFLFRDDENRDHMAEFTFLGLGHWSTHRSVESVNTNRLFTPLGAYADVITYIIETGGFNFANVQQFGLKTKFDSYEWNYRLRYRHRKDQMELGPDGTWTRKMMPSGFHSFLFGLRYVNLRERFGWQSEAVLEEEFLAVTVDDNGNVTEWLPRLPATGDIRIRTRNDLVGFQIGADAIHQRARWSVGVRGKAGPFVDFSRQDTDLVIDDPTVAVVYDLPGQVDRHVRAHEEKLSFVGDLGVFANYHINPNVTLRVAYEALWLSAVANAAEQVEFDTAATPLVRAGGSQTYMGLSFGFDWYW